MSTGKGILSAIVNLPLKIGSEIFTMNNFSTASKRIQNLGAYTELSRRYIGGKTAQISDLLSSVSVADLNDLRSLFNVDFTGTLDTLKGKRSNAGAVRWLQSLDSQLEAKRIQVIALYWIIVIVSILLLLFSLRRLGWKRTTVGVIIASFIVLSVSLYFNTIRHNANALKLQLQTTLLNTYKGTLATDGANLKLSNLMPAPIVSIVFADNKTKLLIGSMLVSALVLLPIIKLLKRK